MELQYLHEYAGISTSIGLTANPIVNFSGVVGNSCLSLGTDLSFDTATGNFTKYNAGLGFSNADLIAALTLWVVPSGKIFLFFYFLYTIHSLLLCQHLLLFKRKIICCYGGLVLQISWSGLCLWFNAYQKYFWDSRRCISVSVHFHSKVYVMNKTLCISSLTCESKYLLARSILISY